jgi:FlaA1/EpsC-like NDP-sugar epimerase
MSETEGGTLFETAGGISAAVTRTSRPASKPVDARKLSAAALAIAAQRFVPAYSPIVLAGMVRLIEFALVFVVGFTVYAGYVVPAHGFHWYYAGAIAGIATMAMLAFQAADIYQVQAFRGHEKQYMRLASAWSVVFLIAISVSFFAKAGDQFSRAWLGTFYVLGLFTLVAFRRGLFRLVRHWTRQGRLDRRAVVVGADANGV